MATPERMSVSIGLDVLVIDQPGPIAQLCLSVARTRGTPVAYVAGLVMRRAAHLCPGEAKPHRVFAEPAPAPAGAA